MLFVFGCGCVTGYLFYHYDNTSLTTGYTTQERVERNKQMHAILEEEADAEGDCVAIIGSAYKKFLGREITYQVAYYAAEEVADPDDLWELKKTPASKHEALTLLGNAEIVINDRTGEVLSVTYLPVS